MKTTTETFTLQIYVAGEVGAWRWVKRGGKKVELKSRKALRNFVRNQFNSKTVWKVFLNGQEITLD